MPCGDVPGRVHVSMPGVAAGRAAEQRLALATVGCHVPALGAPLASERGINLLHSPSSLILQAAGQQAPATGEDAAVEPGLLPNVAARVGEGAAGGTGHAGDTQVLDPDQVEAAGEIGGGLLRPVFAPFGLAGPEPRDRGFDAVASVSLYGLGQT